MLSAIKNIGVYDAIDKAIIEVLSGCEALSILEITRRVKKLRGTASRRIIRERVKKLVDMGILAEVGEKRVKYVLTSCTKVVSNK